VSQDRPHLVSVSQVVPCGPEPFVELHVVGVEHRVRVDALEVPSPLKQKIEEVPATHLERQVERPVALKLQAVVALQEKRSQGVLTGLEAYLQGRLGPGALRYDLRRHLKRLPIGNPPLDVVEPSFTAELVERAKVIKR
jgi:hypothetical protein